MYYANRGISGRFDSVANSPKRFVTVATTKKDSEKDGES